MTRSTSSRLKPASIVLRLRRLPTNNPAPTTSTNDKATCDTTRTLPSGTPGLPLLTVRAFSFRTGLTSTCVARRAGARPNNTPVSRDAAVANARMCGSGPTCKTRGVPPLDMKATRKLLPQNANRRPARPPRKASRTDSLRNWRIKRKREAPSASRTASSLRREASRAKSRFAMFAQAMSNTKPTMVMRIKSGLENCWRNRERPVAADETSIFWERNICRVWSSLICEDIPLRICLKITSTSARTFSIVTSGLSRASTLNQLTSPSGGRRSVTVVMGIQKSGALPACNPKNSGGVTPMIVNGFSSTVICFPMAEGSPPKRRCHRP